MDLSIIIVNWNTKQLLDNCLASIYRETQNIFFEIFVVDNASSDGSAEMV
ncbi:glycosyltransferase, partial [Patescibacteria group bacterium]|nr:glycosyltransferase [Patescibacteria group bacterium]